jgi:hypothetical protein
MIQKATYQMRNRFLSILVTACVLITTGCDKNFEEINKDPTKLPPEAMNYNYVFTSALLITSGNSDANAYEDWRNNLIYGSTMIQHLSSTTGYWAGDKYTYNASYNSAYWDANYNNSIKNIVDVVEQTKNISDQKNLHNIARIFKVFMFQRMTDMYGDIPYTEAGKGYIEGITHPKYDKQQDIYNDFLVELKDAAEKLDASAPDLIGAADLIYEGDVAKWKKFAYSEMVRVAMRLSKADPDKAKTWVQIAVTGGVFADNSDNALVQHENKQNSPVANGNAWILAGQDPNATRISKTLIDLLKNNNDPRLSSIAVVAADPSNKADKGNNDPTIQLGQPNGYDLGSSATNITNAPNWPGHQNKYSIVNRNTYARLEAPVFFLTHSVTQLLLAEASQRGWITTGTAASYYNAGVTAAILQMNQVGASPNLTSAQATAYLTENAYNPATGLQQINTQYWINTFLDSYEAWANWRRSGFPVLTPVNYFGNATGGTIPRRFTYPLNEAAVNAENYSAAVAGLNNGDKMTSRVWWDKQ